MSCWHDSSFDLFAGFCGVSSTFEPTPTSFLSVSSFAPNSALPTGVPFLSSAPPWGRSAPESTKKIVSETYIHKITPLLLQYPPSISSDLLSFFCFFAPECKWISVRKRKMIHCNKLGFVLLTVSVKHIVIQSPFWAVNFNVNFTCFFINQWRWKLVDLATGITH